MARNRARLTLVVNRARRPTPAAAASAAWSAMCAESLRELKARGLLHKPARASRAQKQGA